MTADKLKAIFYFTTLLLCIPVFQIHATSSISYAEGRVSVHRSGRVFSGEIGVDLMAGDRIETQEGSMAILELENRGVLKILENTSLILDNLNDSMQVSLNAGNLFAKIRKMSGKSFNVFSQNVIAGVRGTQFYMAYSYENPENMWLCVKNGRVEVSLQDSEDTVLVKKGEGISIIGGKEFSEPQRYEWTKNLNWDFIAP